MRQDHPGVFCGAARELHERVLITSERRHMDLNDMVADDDVSLQQYTAILKQATVMQLESPLTTHSTSMLPEVINMLFILLCEIYPRHEFWWVDTGRHVLRMAADTHVTTPSALQSRMLRQSRC